MFDTNGTGSKERVHGCEGVDDITALLYDLGANEEVEVLGGKKDYNEFDRQKEISNLKGIDKVLKKLEIEATGESNLNEYSVDEVIDYLGKHSEIKDKAEIQFPDDKYNNKNNKFLNPKGIKSLENELSSMFGQYQIQFDEEIDNPYSGSFSLQLKERDPKANTMQWFAAGLLAYIASDTELADEYGIRPVAKAEVGSKKEGNSSYINFQFNFQPTYKKN